MFTIFWSINVCTQSIFCPARLGCSLCDNEPLFKMGEHVAVPPLPPVAIIKKCEKLNHHKCFAQSLEADQRFAHSVEELVVWMVESEKECSFEQFASTNGLFQAHSSTDAAKCKLCGTVVCILLCTLRGISRGLFI